MIVYFSLPAYGHVNPTLPVVRELVRRGHGVVYYASEPFRRAIEETGAHFRAYCPQFRMPQQGPGAFAQVSSTLETLLDLSCAVLQHHLSEVRELAPSHVMFDSFAPWGSMVARLLRRPVIASIPSILINADIAARYEPAPQSGSADPRLTAEWYLAFQSRCQARLSACGFRDPPAPPQLLQTYGDLNLVYTSPCFQPSLEAFDPLRFRFVGPCFDFRPATPAFPFEWLDGRPLVLVSLGTVYGHRPEFFSLCLEDLAGGPWQVVLAAGSDFPLQSLEPLPENCIVRPFVPQIELLRRSAAFITHAGMNSVQEALCCGVPLLMAPQGADQFWISARTAELGAGIVLASPPIEAGAIRAGIEKLLFNPSYRAAAAGLGAPLRAAGGASRAANEIDDFLQREMPAPVYISPSTPATPSHPSSCARPPQARSRTLETATSLEIA